MKIVSLKATNFMRLSAVEIKADGNSVIITGKNGAGKSSVLDAITSALGGKKASPSKPVKDGEKNGQIVVETDMFTVTRFYSKTGTRVQITNKDGCTAKSPQALLDKVVGQVSFDPLEYLRKPAKARRAILLDMLGIDCTALDQKIGGAKELAKNLRRDCEPYAAEIKHYASTLTDDVKEVNPKQIKELLTLIDGMVLKNEEINNARRMAEGTQESIANQHREIERLANIIKQAEITKADALKSQEMFDLELEGLLVIAKQELSVIEPLQGQLNDLRVSAAEYEKNQLCREAKKRNETLLAEIEKRIEEQKSIQEMSEEHKRRLLEEAVMPLPGLTVSEDEVLFDGIPLSQVNTAKQYEVCIAIAMKLNPKLKVVRLSGNDLDDDTLRTILSMVKKNDYQAWVERIGGGTDGAMTVEIADGAAVPPNSSGSQDPPSIAEGGTVQQSPCHETDSQSDGSLFPPDPQEPAKTPFD